MGALEKGQAVLSIIARWWIVPGKEAEAVAALKELAAEVEAQEPYTLMYTIHTTVTEGSRPPAPDNEVVFLSTWPDHAAFEEHLNGPVFKEWIAKYLDLFLTGDGDSLFVTGEFLERQAGYIRPSLCGGTA